MKRAQSSRILDYLATGRTLTPIKALEKFGCFRLAARIAELRDDGHPIISVPIKTKSGARIAKYALCK